MAGQDTWTVTQASAANAAQTLTKAAVADTRHRVSGFSCVVIAAAAGADIGVDLQFGGVSKVKDYIGSGAARGTRLAFAFDPPLDPAENTAITLVVDAGGAAAVTRANLYGFSEV